LHGKSLLLILLIVLCIPTIKIVADHPTIPTDELYTVAVYEELNGIQTGNLTNPYILNLTKHFDYVSVIKIVIEFEQINLNYGTFGGDTALTNGFNIIYDGFSFINNDNITNNFQLCISGTSCQIVSDEQNPKHRIITTSFDFDKFSHDLLISQDYGLSFYIQDDITALSSIAYFEFQIYGYRELMFSFVESPVGEKFDPLNLLEDFINQNSMNIYFVLITLIVIVITYRVFRR